MKSGVVAIFLLAALYMAACQAPATSVRVDSPDGTPAVDVGPSDVYSRVVPPVRLPEPGVPLVSIVIDDCGESLEQIVPFLGIPVPLSFSVLPYRQGVPETVATLFRHGRETLVHVPMEPHDPKWLENEWFLRVGMTAGEIRERLTRALNAVPTATGMNNHMGSRFCADQASMSVVMQVARENGVYYLDSRTAPGSVARQEAGDAGTRFLERDVFLDNNDDVAAIGAQLEELVETARKNGCAVGIGHARTRTAEAIMGFVRDRDHGVAFVPAGLLFDRCHAKNPGVPSDQARIPPE